MRRQVQSSRTWSELFSRRVNPDLRLGGDRQLFGHLVRSLLGHGQRLDERLVLDQ